MILAGNDNHVDRTKRLVTQFIVPGRQQEHGQIDIEVKQGIFDLHGLRRQKLETEAAVALQSIHDSGDDDTLEGICHDQPEMPLAGFRMEILDRRKARLNGAERMAHRTDDLLGP